MRRLSCFILLFILVAAEFGCRKKAAGPPPRYAVVRFENLSGDPALDWIGRAASETLSVSLAGALDGPVLNSSALGRLAPALGSRPATAPGISSERAEALLAGATRLISGYVERAGDGIRIVATDEDPTTGKTLRTVSTRSASGPASTLSALKQLAHAFSPNAKPYLTTNASASQHYFLGLEAPLDTSQSDLEQAVRLDPDFGPAWLALTRLARLRGDRNAAEDWIAQAHKHKLDPLTLAELDSEAAALRGGSGIQGSEIQNDAAKIAAMRKVCDLSPGDTILLHSLADNETAIGQFAAAASDWKKLADMLPGDPSVWNSLGYARSWAGDYAGAMAALEEYRRLRPNDANPLDSIGDVQYVNRKFSEAAASYLQAHAKDANFERSGDLYKAAWAKFRAGDKAGADSLFAQFRTAREKTSDTLLPLLAADWLYRTGRAGEAVALLRRTVKETQSAQLRAESYSQLAIWELLAVNRAKAREDAMASGNPASAPMAMMRFAVEPSGSAAEWQERAARAMAAPAMAQFRRLALGYALLLDGKREAAIPVWEEIVMNTPATDFFSRAIYGRLRKQPGERPLLPDPNNVNQFAALLDKL